MQQKAIKHFITFRRKWNLFLVKKKITSVIFQANFSSDVVFLIARWVDVEQQQRRCHAPLKREIARKFGRRRRRRRRRRFALETAGAATLRRNSVAAPRRRRRVNKSIVFALSSLSLSLFLPYSLFLSLFLSLTSILSLLPCASLPYSLSLFLSLSLSRSFCFFDQETREVKYANQVQRKAKK